MNEIYIARWQTSCNSVVFLICKDEKLFLKEKFYDGPRSVSGEPIILDIEIPENIKEEILSRSSWIEPMSSELKQFVDDIKKTLAKIDLA